MDLTNKSDLGKAGDYAQDVLNWAVEQFGEQILLAVTEDRVKFIDLARKYNEAYDSFVERFLNLNAGIQKGIIREMGTRVYAKVVANETSNRLVKKNSDTGVRAMLINSNNFAGINGQ